ncbi:MAG: replication-relaxation family protein [Hyphomicrobiaceae bacterium]
MTLSPTNQTPTTRKPAFSITPRILGMLEAVARYGLLTSEQIARLDGGSRQKVTRFLQSLVQLGLLRLVDAAPEEFVGSFFDARPRVFAITTKGLEVLGAAGIRLNVKPKRSNTLLAHDIACAETMFKIVSAVAAHGGVRLFDQPELMAMMPVKTRRLSKPLRLRPTAQPRDYPHLGEILRKPAIIATDPDRLFALVLPDNTGWSFALELDRGNEDITAQRIKGRATFFRKVLGYNSARLSGLVAKQWGDMCTSMRVVVVTISESHIASMIQTQRHVGAPAGLILYSTPERLGRIGPLGPAWITGKRDGVSLLDRA